MSQLADPIVAPATEAEYGPLFRISVERYHEMVASGALTSEDRIELLEGLLVQKMSKDPIHSAVSTIVQQMIAALLSNGWFARIEQPITTDDSEPEPDVSVVRGRPQEYLRRHPGPAETALLIEVANTTLARDRGVKQRIYAAAGCQAYWVMNTAAREVEVYSDPRKSPQGSYYRSRTVFTAAGDRVPLVVDGNRLGELDVAEMIPAMPPDEQR